MIDQARMEGSWQLEQWAAEGRVWPAPECHGRFMLRDGVVVFHATRPAATGPGTYARYAYGYYRFEGNAWSYGYHHDTSDGVSVSHDFPWQGLRTFLCASQDPTLRLVSPDEHYALEFSEKRFDYIERGQLVRSWTRLGGTLAPTAPIAG
jgi:hypothetical protein